MNLFLIQIRYFCLQAEKLSQGHQITYIRTSDILKKVKTEVKIKHLHRLKPLTDLIMKDKFTEM